MSIPETIHWHDAAQHKPDSDITVLCAEADGFFTGYWDAAIASWIDCASGGQVHTVTHWAEPSGPQNTRPMGSGASSPEVLSIIAKHIGSPTKAQRACMAAGHRLTNKQVRNALKKLAAGGDAPMRTLCGQAVDLRAPWTIAPSAEREPQ